MEKRSFKNYLSTKLKNKWFVAIVATYLVLLLASSIYWCINWHFRNFFMSLGYMLFIPAILFSEYWLKIRLGNMFVASLLFIAFGSILGCCFDIYTYIPFFDTALHGVSGVVFACVGFTLAEKFFGKAENGKKFAGCLIFAVLFSLSIALLWEVFEYSCTVLFKSDMMEDSLVDSINSYFLAGNHYEMVELDGIVKTLIYLENGQVYTINGYLDLGLIDTMVDMIICTIGAGVFGVIATFSRKKAPKINELLIPKNENDSGYAIKNVTNDN